MSLATLLAQPAWPVLLALVAGLLLVAADVRSRAWVTMVAGLLVLGPCAAVLARGGAPAAALAPLVGGLVVAALARDDRDPLPGECALKLLWLLGGALALSAVGSALLTLGTGVTAPPEQWNVLQLGLVQRTLWSVALPLALLAGVVLLGGAPFHFWVADLFQGASAALAPLAVAALQLTGAVWLTERLAGIETFGEGARLTAAVLRTVAAAALLAGAGTILAQRRPERRVGTLTSIQGGIVLAMLASQLGRPPGIASLTGWLAAWAAHQSLALSGAALLARLAPVDRVPGEPGAHLFRRHPLTALAGLYSLFSLAGVPGTPGATFWLGLARVLVERGSRGLLVALALAWLAAFAAAMRELREGFGAPTAVPPERPVHWPVRLALWLSGGGIAVLGAARLILR